MSEQKQTPAVASSSVPKSLQSMTKEERAKRFAELRRRLGRSKLFVEGEEGIHYFWAPADDETEMARLDYVGYSLVKESNAKEVLAGKVEPKIKAAGLRADGTYKQGDVILMQCPQELYEFIMLDNEQRHQEMALGANADFLTSAEEKGVPIIEVNKTSVRRE